MYSGRIYHIGRACPGSVSLATRGPTLSGHPPPRACEAWLRARFSGRRVVPCMGRISVVGCGLGRGGASCRASGGYRATVIISVMAPPLTCEHRESGRTTAGDRRDESAIACMRGLGTNSLLGAAYRDRLRGVFRIRFLIRSKLAWRPIARFYLVDPVPLSSISFSLNGAARRGDSRAYTLHPLSWLS